MADVNDVGGNSSFDWGAAMNAVAEIGGAMITSGSGRKSQKRARQYSEELMRIQDELNDQNALDSFNRSLEAWHMQNAYNSPTAQRERLEAAGLNPALLYGNASGATVSNAGGLSPAPSSSAGTQSVGVTPPVVFGNIAESIAQIDLMKSQANKNNAEAEDIRGDTEPAKLAMSLTEQSITLAKENIIGKQQQNDIDAFNNQLRKKWGESNAEAENRALVRRAEIAMEELISARDYNALNPKRVEQIDAMINNIVADTLNKQATEALNRALKNNTDYERKFIMPYVSDKIQREIDRIINDIEASGYNITLLSNAVRDYDANWWNGTLQGWLGSIFSGGQAASQIYKNTQPHN